MLLLMTSLLTASCAALHVSPMWGAVRPTDASVAYRAAVLRMDEEAELYAVPFSTNVTAAADDIKEVLTPQGFEGDEPAAPSPEAAAKAKWLAKTYGEPSSTPPADASPTQEPGTPSAEDVDKAAWLAARARPSWGGKTD